MVIIRIRTLRDYITLQVWGLPCKVLWLIGAVLTIAPGVVIFINPFAAVETAWTRAGYFLNITGAIDLFIFILSFSCDKKMNRESRPILRQFLFEE